MPTISVVTVCLNPGKTLWRTRESLATQSTKDFEWVVVDGGSTDGTREFLAAGQYPLSRHVSESDEGIADAFNKGARIAKGDYLLYLNAGDELAGPTVLKRVLECISGSDMDSTASVDRYRTLWYGDAEIVHPYRRYLQIADHQGLPSRNSICHQAVLISRQLQIEYPFDKRFKVNMDYDLWLRLLPCADFQKIGLTVCRFHADGLSQIMRKQRTKLIEHEIARLLNTPQPWRFRYLILLCLRVVQWEISQRISFAKKGILRHYFQYWGAVDRNT